MMEWSAVVNLFPVAWVMVGVWALWYAGRKDAGLALAKGWVMFWVVVWGITEGLSMSGMLGPVAAKVCWWGVAAVLGLVVWKREGLNQKPRLKGLSKSGMFLGACVAVVAAGTLLAGSIYPPNNADSMTYHLPRVMHWAQNMSVDPYPTHSYRQAHLTPLAEYGILQLYLLTGSDRWFFLVQWSAMLASVGMVAGLARRMGAVGVGPWIAAVVCVTLPMGVLQASSTQNDYLAAVFLVAVALLAWESAKEPRNLPLHAFVGLAAGLAVLTKGTDYLYVFPVLCSYGLAVVWRGRAMATGGVLLAAVLFLLVNAPFYSRNMEMSGHPLGIASGSKTEGYYSNDSPGPATVVSNFARSLALNLQTPSGKINDALEWAVIGGLELAGMDPHDEGTTLRGSRFYVPVFASHEDRTGNPVHTILMMVSVVLAVAGFWMAGGGWRPLVYAVVWLAALLFYLALLKWQPWGVRLMLPLFVAACPLVGWAVERWLRGRVALVLACVLMVPVFVWYLPQNPLKPLLPLNETLSRRLAWNESREVLYYSNLPYPEKTFRQHSRELEILKSAGDGKNVRIGLISSGVDFEYPVWVLIQRKMKQEGRDFTLHHVGVEWNPSRSLNLRGEAAKVDVLVRMDRDGFLKAISLPLR